MADRGYRGITVTPTRNEYPQPEHNPDAFAQMQQELTGYVARCTQQRAPINPFHASSCVMEPAQGKFPSLITSVDLEMTYNHHQGFNAVWLRMAQLANTPEERNKIVDLSTRISNNHFIPTAVQAASLHVPDATRKKLSDLFDEAKVEHHMDVFRDELRRKGYKELFAGRVDDVPLQWVLREQFHDARARDVAAVKPFKLITQLSGPDFDERKNAPVIQGEFTTTYSPTAGFRVKELVVSSSETGRRVERPIHSNNDIPNKAEVLMLSHRRKNGIKR